MTDGDFMNLALAEARAAASEGEVPVGAVIVHRGEVIATGRNAPLALCDPSAHAEILALRAAAIRMGNYRLDECELYVTLEPCPMCAGAMLHARIKRVVYGAPDPKTGAAGSVVNLFALGSLNHQTRVESGVLSVECGEVLKSFFKRKRVLQRHAAEPLREDALRTPEARFAGLPDFGWQPHYLSSLPALDRLRLHYLDEGPEDAPRTWLCLHGNPSWSYVYRHMIPQFLAAGDRVVAPDLIGFGRSDKPKREAAHTFGWHRQVLLEFIERLDLQRIVLVVQDWGGLLGLTLPMEMPSRFSGVLLMNTMLATGDHPLSSGFLAWREMCRRKPGYDVGRLMARGNPQLSAEECRAYDAPFPDRGYRAALRAFPNMVPETPQDDGAAISREALAFWRDRWEGQSMMAIGVRDPVLGEPVMRQLQGQIRGCHHVMVLPDAGHFVQEHGAEVAAVACGHFHRRSASADQQQSNA